MNIDLGLKDKVAIVTGAGGGIGREIALALANEGVKILANDIGVSLSGEGGSIQPAEETCGLIIQKGGEAIPDTNSVTSWSSASKIIENALDKVENLRGVTYEWKEDRQEKDGHSDNNITPERIGVIAQEILDIVPEVVTHDKENDRYGVSYGHLTGLLIEAVKDLSNKVKDLEKLMKEKKSCNVIIKNGKYFILMN